MVMDEQHRVHAGNDTELCTFFRVETINIRLPPFCHNNCFFHGSLKRITRDKQSRAPAQPPEPEVQAERGVGGPGKGFLTRSRASLRCTPRSRGAPPPSTRLAQSLVPRGSPGPGGPPGAWKDILLRCTRYLLIFVSSHLPRLLLPLLQQTSNCQASTETINLLGR